MNGRQVGGIAIELYDRHGKISRNAREGKDMSTFSQDEYSLDTATIRVARSMGVDLKAAANLKYKFGKGGLSGVALFSDERPTNPWGIKIRPVPPTNPGRLSDDADEDDDPGVISIRYPDGSTSVTKKRGKK
jgi:hypothetical protein